MATGTVKWRGQAREVMSPVVAERRATQFCRGGMRLRLLPIRPGAGLRA